MSRFSEKYKNEVAPALMQKFGYSSVMQIPKFNKIVINVGAGDARENSKVIDKIIEEITLISGQQAVPTYAHKSIANFKLREATVGEESVSFSGISSLGVSFWFSSDTGGFSSFDAGGFSSAGSFEREAERIPTITALMQRIAITAP